MNNTTPTRLARLLAAREQVQSARGGSSELDTILTDLFDRDRGMVPLPLTTRSALLFLQVDRERLRVDTIEMRAGSPWCVILVWEDDDGICARGTGATLELAMAAALLTALIMQETGEVRP